MSRLLAVLLLNCIEIVRKWNPLPSIPLYWISCLPRGQKHLTSGLQWAIPFRRFIFLVKQSFLVHKEYEKLEGKNLLAFFFFFFPKCSLLVLHGNWSTFIVPNFLPDINFSRLFWQVNFISMQTALSAYTLTDFLSLKPWENGTKKHQLGSAVFLTEKYICYLFLSI